MFIHQRSNVVRALAFACVTVAAPHAGAAPPTAAITKCTPEERRDAFVEMQHEVLSRVPQQLDNIETALAQGGPLAGYRLSHGYTVVSGAGAVALDNLRAAEPFPPLLLYAPDANTPPAKLKDFEHADGPYHLVGWGYFAPYQTGTNPPDRRCVEASEWLVHEAGWHLKNGGMKLTPGAATEPPRPAIPEGIYFWHSRTWDLHFWLQANGVPKVSYQNPNGSSAGLALPDGAFFSAP